MYYPYFRGKQFELIAVREAAALMAASEFVPIIEPVREPMNGLRRALEAICEANGSAILIVNPDNGDHAGNGEEISKFLVEAFCDKDIRAGILLSQAMTVEAAMAEFERHKAHNPVFVHAGFTAGKSLAEK